MKNLYAAIAATVIGLPVPVEAIEPIELGYFLPRTAITVTVKQRLEACPKGGDDLNDFITTTVVVEHKAEADPAGFVRLDGRSGFLAKRTTELGLRANGTLESFNAKTEGHGRAVISSLIKVGAKIASFSVAGARAPALHAGAKAPAPLCSQAVANTLEQVARAKADIKAAEDAIVSGTAGDAILEVISARKQRIAALREALTISTTTGDPFYYAQAAQTPKSGFVSAVKVPSQSPWNSAKAQFKLNSPPYEDWFDGPVPATPVAIEGSLGFLVTLELLDGATRTDDADLAAALKEPQAGLFYRRPLPAKIAVQACTSVDPGDSCLVAAPPQHDPAASVAAIIPIAEASKLYKLSIGKGGIFGSKQASAKFDEWGAPLQLAYGSDPGAADIAGTIDAAGEAAGTLHDAKLSETNRRIAILEAQKKLEELEAEDNVSDGDLP